MDVSRIRALRGPNLWSRNTAIEAIVRCGAEEADISRLPGFETRLHALFPAIGEHWPIDGDVLNDIRKSDRISHVMQNGRLFESPTMNEVVSRQKARKPFFFDGADGRSMPIDERSHGAEGD